MLAGMELDSTLGRDARLERAAHLLQKPVKKPPSLIGALVASAGLAGATLLLATTLVFEPGADETKAQTVQSVTLSPQAAATSSAAPAFELSSSSIAAPVSDAGVVAGSEGAR